MKLADEAASGFSPNSYSPLKSTKNLRSSSTSMVRPDGQERPQTAEVSVLITTSVNALAI
jgi:hypothetical protein